MRSHVNMSKSCRHVHISPRAYDYNWLLRFLWGPEFEINGKRRDRNMG